MRDGWVKCDSVYSYVYREGDRVQGEGDCVEGEGDFLEGECVCVCRMRVIVWRVSVSGG